MEQSGALVLTLPESQAAENPTPMRAAWGTGQHPWAVREPEAGPALGFLSLQAFPARPSKGLRAPISLVVHPCSLAPPTFPEEPAYSAAC